MSLWNDFVDAITFVPKQVGNLGKDIATSLVNQGKQAANIAVAAGPITAASLAAPTVTRNQPQTEQALIETTLKAIEKNKPFDISEKEISNDIFLRAAVAAEEKVISPFVTRPFSTGFLLTDKESKLYKEGEFQAGFQLSDISAAYKRSEEVSMAQSFTKSSLRNITPVGLLSDYVLGLGDIKVEDIDLWDNDNIQKNFHDNLVGKYWTGALDIVGGNFAIAAAGKGVAKIVGGIGKWAGIQKSNVDLATIEKNINDGIDFSRTQGAQGVNTVVGADIVRLAQTNDRNVIIDVLFGNNVRSGYTNNERLIPLIAKSTDETFVRDLILADKMYYPALERLSQKAPADFAELTGLETIIRNNVVERGGVWVPDELSAQRINRAFDDAIDKVPAYRDVRDALFDPKSATPLGLGKDFTPIEPIVGKKVVIATRQKTSELRAKMVGREFDFKTTGGFFERNIGKAANFGTTRMIRLAGTRLPVGTVNLSGVRPLDGIREINAFFDNFDLFKDGSKLIRRKDGSVVTAGAYRADAIRLYTDATNAGQQLDVLKFIDDAIGHDLALTYGFTDLKKLNEFVTEIRARVSAGYASITQKGYAFDIQGNRLLLDAQTQRQLADTFKFGPWNIVEKMIQSAMASTPLQRRGVLASDVTKTIYEDLNRLWTFDALARPNYIAKNSLAEPLLSAGISEGTSFIFKNVPNMTANFFKNNVNRFLDKSTTILNLGQRKAVRDAVTYQTDKLNEAIIRLDNIQAEYDDFFVNVNRSPSAINEHGAKVKKELAAAQRQVDELELQFREAIKPFGEVGAVPSIALLERRLKYLESTTTSADKKVELFPGLQSYKDGGSGGLPGTGETVGFVKTSALRGMSGNLPGDAEALAAYRKSLRQGKGFAIRDYEGKPYQDPIMVIYDNETGLAFVGEGNHRLQAAIDESIPYVPVRVVQGYKSEMVTDAKKGRFPQQIKNGKEPKFVSTRPGDNGRPVGKGYVPPEMHPSYVFDKKFIVDKDEFVKSNFSAQYGSAIANAKAAIGAVRGEINTIMPDSKALLAKNAEIEKTYKEIDDILKSLGEASVREADVFGKSTAFKKRYYGKEKSWIMVKDQWVPLESMFDENFYGKALREELGNARTIDLTYTGNLVVGTRQGILNRRGPRTVTDVSDPDYFKELAYVANRSMRKDPLIDQILANASEEELVDWIVSPTGQKYMSQFNITSNPLAIDYVRDKIALVNGYFPDAQARALILEREVYPEELQKILGDKVDRLQAIHPLDFDYDLASTSFGSKGLATIDMYAQRAASAVFRKLAAPENAIRWAYADEKFTQQIQRRIDTMVKQGMPVSIENINAMRSAAVKEVIQETEKTFYTIPRQNRLLWSARLISAFPSASANAFYRYGRLAIKNPVRIAGVLHSYQGLYSSFGVDKYGNPVDNPLDATHIVVPFTKDLGWNKGQGVRVSAKAIGFMLNIPTPSIWGASAVGAILTMFPKSEPDLKQALGGYYDLAFPYGTQKPSWTSLAPNWSGELRNWVQGPKGKQNFLESWVSVNEYYNTLAEMGYIEKKTDAEIYEITKSLWGIKARTSFASKYGVPEKVDLRPMELFDNYYYILYNKYKSQGKSDDESAKWAGDELLATLGANFPLDRITFKGSSKNLPIPATNEAYSRIWERNGNLVNALSDIKEGDISLVGLLTADIERDPSESNLAIYRFISNPNTKLPNGKLVNDVALSPTEIEKERNVNRSWAKYTAKKEELTKASIQDGFKSLRQDERRSADLREYANTELRQDSQIWWNRWNQGSSGDNAFSYARGLWTVVTDKTFMNKHGDQKFWMDAKQFVLDREVISSIYKALPTRDPRKSALKEFYLYKLEKDSTQWHPKLQQIISRYFENDTMKAVR